MTARYLLRRVGQLLPTVVVVLVATFLLIHLAPGDPVLALAGQHGDAAYYAAMRQRFGLDRPLGEQLLVYLGRVGHGDLGTSYIQGRPALRIVLERVPATALLAATALVISTVLGVAGGVAAARRAERPADLTLRTATLVAYAAPSFFLAQLALLTLAFGLGLFPIHGMTDPRGVAGGFGQVVDVLHHLALPALVLAATEVALNTRLVRASLLETWHAEYVRTARCKGLPERRILYHALRNALLPVVTVIGTRAGMFLTGAVLVEIVFAWPGLGRLLLTAAQARDYPVLLAIFLVASAVVVTFNLVTDLVYAILDPRIRYE